MARQKAEEEKKVLMPLGLWHQDNQIEPAISYSEPRICHYINNLPTDHVLTEQEESIRAACVSQMVNSRQVWASEAIIDHELGKDSLQPAPPPRPAQHPREVVELGQEQDQNVYVEPEICKRVDNLPKDHIWTEEEESIRGACGSNIVNGRRAWMSEENIEREMAREKAQEEANRNRKGTVIHGTPKVYDKDGNLLDDAAQQKIARDGWNKLLASGQCTKVAQDLVKNNDEYQESCQKTGYRDPNKCERYFREAQVLSACAVSPDDPEHGYKRRAIRRDPMPTAIVMAQEKTVTGFEPNKTKERPSLVHLQYGDNSVYHVGDNHIPVQRRGESDTAPMKMRFYEPLYIIS